MLSIQCSILCHGISKNKCFGLIFSIQYKKNKLQKSDFIWLCRIFTMKLEQQNVILPRVLGIGIRKKCSIKMLHSHSYLFSRFFAYDHTFIINESGRIRSMLTNQFIVCHIYSYYYMIVLFLFVVWLFFLVGHATERPFTYAHFPTN